MSPLPFSPRSDGAAGSHQADPNRSFGDSVVTSHLVGRHSLHLQFEQATFARLARLQYAGDVYGCYVYGQAAIKLRQRLTETLGLQSPAIYV
jgi:hypothetical protein